MDQEENSTSPHYPHPDPYQQAYSSPGEQGQYYNSQHPHDNAYYPQYNAVPPYGVTPSTLHSKPENTKGNLTNMEVLNLIIGVLVILTITPLLLVVPIIIGAISYSRNNNPYEAMGKFFINTGRVGAIFITVIVTIVIMVTIISSTGMFS